MERTGGRHVRFALGVALLALLSVQCGGNSDESVDEDGPATAEPQTGAASTVDGPKRVVSFSPNITETLFALGQGGRVVGVTAFCYYPSEAARLEKVGGYLNPDLEKVTMLSPDLIVLLGRHDKVAEYGEKSGTPVLHVDMNSLATIDGGIRQLGEAMACGTEADALRGSIRDFLDGVRRAVEGRPRPKVLIVTTRQSHDLNSLYTVGGESFVSEVVEIAGGVNIYADADQAYLEASKETVVLRAPEVILEFHAGESLSPEERAQYVADWDRLSSLPAVAAGRVHLVTESYALLAGPRVTLTAHIIASLLHPEVEIPEP